MRRPYGERATGLHGVVLVSVWFVASCSASAQIQDGVDKGLKEGARPTTGEAANCRQEARRVLATSYEPLPEFWVYDAASLPSDGIQVFRRWYSRAQFKEVSPRIGQAWFRKGPFHQGIDFDESGRLAFVRVPTDGDDHTLLEVSVDESPGRGNYVEYGGYRAMKLGVPYEIDITVAVYGDHWWKDIPWALVIQGHAIPDAPKAQVKYNPPFGLFVIRGRWQVHIRADERRELPVDRSYRRFDRIDLGAVEQGKAIDVRIRVIWSYDNAAGVMAIWRDGVQYHSEVGRRNFYNTQSPAGEPMGPYITFGAYISAKDLGRQMATVKFSKLRIAGGSWQGLADCGNGDLGATVPAQKGEATLWQ